MAFGVFDTLSGDMLESVALRPVAEALAADRGGEALGYYVFEIVPAPEPIAHSAPVVVNMVQKNNDLFSGVYV